MNDIHPSNAPAASVPAPESKPSGRLRSQDLLQQAKAIEIDHHGKIYQLRLTRLNKLILTA